VAHDDLVAFAATAEVTLTLGRRYAVVTGWRAHVSCTLHALPAQWRTLSDPPGMTQQVLAAVAAGLRRFAEVVESTTVPRSGRAFLLHLLWHRRLGMDLGAPLADATLIHPGKDRPR
jgi:hypothetical protein